MVTSSGRLLLWVLVMEIWLIFLCAPVSADPCAERAQRVRAGEVPFGEDDPDCTGAEKTGAIFAWLAAAAAAAAAARQVKGGKSARPDDWPKDLKGPNAFCDLGHAIAKEDYLQKQVSTANGGSRGLTDIEKAMYIFERMREAARVYDLRADTGSKADQTTMKWNRRDVQIQVGTAAGSTVAGVALAKWGASAGTLMAGPVGTLVGGVGGAAVGWLIGGPIGSWMDYKASDQENADSLKDSGVGRCGEWSWAFNRVLDCAGISNKVIFADKDGTPGIGGDFYTNDTAVIISQRVGRKEIRRVFDPFRQLHHNPENNGPTEWSNLPMTLDDRLPYDDDPGHRNPTWLTESIGGGKNYIKDHDGGVFWQKP